MSFEQNQQITVLKNKGKIENRDYRVVWFGKQAEIKIVDI